MTKTTKTKVAVKTEVWTMHCVWEDRHGERGNYIEVRGSKDEIDEVLRKDIETYLIDHPLEDMDEIDGEFRRIPKTVDDAVKIAIKGGWIEFNVDSSGTNAKWEVDKHKVTVQV